jgi:alkanesulfonate monooxygenase SsuD/methylene tetrahydromethanopterin reductase-like flavin-dependent oxidoreductase (luciferase family)
MAGATPRWSDVLAMARTVEAVGFDSLWVSDHFMHAIDGHPDQGPWEGWSNLAALAAVTSRVELGTVVMATSFRNPALLAKMADTVDEISGGRLILGIGAGWHEPEYRQMGLPFDHRVSRFEEAIQIIHGLLKHGAVDFEGHFYSARECELRPRGPRPDGPPIMVGTRGHRMLRITALYADLWNVAWPSSADRALPHIAALDDAGAGVGRDPASVCRTAGVMVDIPGAFPHRGHDWVTQLRARVQPLTGSPQEIAAELRNFAITGISHVQIWLDPLTPAGIEAFAPVLEELDERC